MTIKMNSEINKSDDPMLTYCAAGVDIDKANRFVDRIKQLTQQTHRPGVLGGLGSFGACFEIPTHYKQPVLVSGTDGVGTKLKLAQALKRYNTIGIDLVAMCVNDILCQGAEPLFFLDYYATGQLDLEQSVAIVEGISRACRSAHIALIGGETAELPGVYSAGDYDLAGFCVGIVEKDQMLHSNRVQHGDQLIALASSGPHANGYSLIRSVLERSGADYNHLFDGAHTLADALLQPTRIYAEPLLTLLKGANKPHGLAHITGGGLLENVPRCLPPGMQAVIHQDSWEWPAIFSWLKAQGQIEDYEMYRTFNLGVGMVMVLPETAVGSTLRQLRQAGETAWVLGSVQQSQDDTPSVLLT